eukprot:306035-Hanusia_phi.AAC.2
MGTGVRGAGETGAASVAEAQEGMRTSVCERKSEIRGGRVKPYFKARRMLRSLKKKKNTVQSLSDSERMKCSEFNFLKLICWNVMNA